MYELVVDYLKTAKYTVVNGARVYPSEKIVLVDDGKFYVAVQAHTDEAWSKLLKLVNENPRHVLELVRYIESLKEGTVPDTISFIRLKKEDIRG